MTQIVQKALDFLRPHRPHRLFPLCFVSEITRTNAKKILNILMQDAELSASDNEEVKRLIDESPRNDIRNIFNVVNWDGFTLLQRAVINNHLTIVKILIKKGCDINVGICSLPLHLACKLGYVNIAQLLLTHGARANLECTVCYPDEHKLKTCPDQIYCLSYQPVLTPIMYVLCGDHDQILPLLIQHENSRQLVKTDFLLHEACKMGAYSCSRYLLKNHSEQMTQENMDGRTPLQISLVMDAESALFLIANGAELKDTVFLTENGSTVHELYRRKISLGLLKATKFALEHGFRSHINVRDQEGNTALYVLLKHVGRTVKGNIQSEYDHEIQESVKLLLYHGSNPNIPNHLGENALHAVLSDSAARPLYVSRHGQVRRLKPVLQEIFKVVEILLAHGADPGQRSSSGFVSPLFYAVRIFQSLQPDMFVVVKTALKQLFQLICHENCNLNVTDSYGLTIYVHLLHGSYIWIASNATNVAFCRTVIPFLACMLQLFLKRGLNANARLNYFTHRMEETIDSSYFREILMFISLQHTENLIFYDSIRQLLLKLVQRGGNPNLLIFNSSYETHEKVAFTVPRNASLSLIIARALYNQNESALPKVLEFITFFFKTLCHNKLLEFTYSLNLFINADSRSETLGADSLAHLQCLSKKPRSLLQLCRIIIADNLQWKLAKKCILLPLPKADRKSVV